MTRRIPAERAPPQPPSSTAPPVSVTNAGRPNSSRGPLPMKPAERPGPIVLSIPLRLWNGGVRSQRACAKLQKIFAFGLSPPNLILCVLSIIRAREVAGGGAQQAMADRGCASKVPVSTCGAPSWQ